MLFCGISCAIYFIRLETKNFWKDVVDITNDFEQCCIFEVSFFDQGSFIFFFVSRATAKDLYFPQVVVCNSNFIQATFLKEFNITEHANLLIQYYFSGSPRDITEKQKKIVGKIEVGGAGIPYKIAFGKDETLIVTLLQEITLARRVAGALMRFGNSTSAKGLLIQVENKTDEELLDLAETNGMPTPLALVTGLKPGFRSILRATYNSKERDPNHMAPFFPAYRTDFGWCSLIIPMVQFEER